MTGMLIEVSSDEMEYKYTKVNITTTIAQLGISQAVQNISPSSSHTIILQNKCDLVHFIPTEGETLCFSKGSNDAHAVDSDTLSWFCNHFKHIPVQDLRSFYIPTIINTCRYDVNRGILEHSIQKLRRKLENSVLLRCDMFPRCVTQIDIYPRSHLDSVWVPTHNNYIHIALMLNKPITSSTKWLQWDLVRAALKSGETIPADWLHSGYTLDICSISTCELNLLIKHSVRTVSDAY